jgi:hypothetical protein
LSTWSTEVTWTTKLLSAWAWTTEVTWST